MQRREQAEVAPRSGLMPTVTLEDVLRACAPALEAVFDWNGEPDWSARFVAAGLLLQTFPKWFRSEPETVTKILQRVLPESVPDREQYEAQKVYSALRDEWNKAPIVYNPVTCLTEVAAYPSYCVAPSADRKGAGAT